MNKRNKILVVCLSLLLALSVGYALFSETITINGTATAKGGFDITATCEKSISNDLLMGPFAQYKDEFVEGGYVAATESCSVTNNVVTINTELQYPTAKRYYTIKMENTGTIDAFVKSTGSDGYPLYINENIKVYNSSTNAIVKELNVDNATQSGDASNYARTSLFVALPRNADGTFLSDDEEYHNNGMLFLDNAGSSYLKIAPGQSLYLVVYTYWQDEATTQGVYSINTSKLTLDFKQKTSDFVESDEAYTCFGGC